MISKEVRRRRLVNRLWHGISSKFRREHELQKDGYRWLVRNFALRGLNPSTVGRRSGKTEPNHTAIANLAKTLFTRYGEFTPDNIARIHQTSSQIEPAWPYADPPSAYELRLKAKGNDRTEDENAVYVQLFEKRHIERRPRPDEAAHTLLTEVASTYGLTPQQLPKELPPDVMEIDPHRQRQLKYEAAPSGYTAFYNRLVDSGFIQEGEEIPEDPPEGWEPPIEGMDEDEPPPDLELSQPEEDPQEPHLPEDDDDFMVDPDT